MKNPIPEAPERRGVRRSTLLVGVAAAAALAVVTLVAGNSHHKSAPRTAPKLTVTALRAPAGIEAKCMVPSADRIATQQIAFEGTVVAIKDGTVTLDPSHFFNGTATDRVSVAAPDLNMTELPVNFQLGQTYIVGATGGQVSLCGMSGLATADLRALYQQAFAK